MKRLILIALAAAAAAPAAAVPITYSFDGRLSGSLSGAEFTLADASFALDSDTDTVFQPTPAVRPTLFNSGSGTLRFTINGQSGTFDLPHNAFIITLGNGATLVGLTETGSNDLIDVEDAGLQGYDLRGPASSVTNSPLDFLNFDTDFSTSLGTLVLFDDDDASVRFTATGGEAGAVPEPAAWATMTLGFGLAGGAARRRRMPVPA